MKKKINVVVTLFTLIFSQAALSNPTSRFIEMTIDDIAKVKKLDSRIKDEDRTLCPTEKSKDMSSCVRSFLLSFEIQSSAQIPLIGVSLINSAHIDKKKGYDKNTAMLMLIDNFALTFERIDVNRFHIVKLNPGVKGEENDIKTLRESESNLLIESKNKVLLLLNKHLAEVAKSLSRSLASTSPGILWQRKKHAELKVRVLDLERKTWKFP